MSSSYYLTYGGDRLTLPGATGSVAWEYVPPTGYYEQLLWSGDIYAQNATAGLSAHPSAFDTIRTVVGGGNAIGNSQLYVTLTTPYKQLSATNRLFFNLPMFGSTSTNGVTAGWMFGSELSGCSGTTWKIVQSWGMLYNSESPSYRYDFSRVKQIWGIHYG